MHADFQFGESGAFKSLVDGVREDIHVVKEVPQVHVIHDGSRLDGLAGGDQQGHQRGHESKHFFHGFAVLDYSQVPVVPDPVASTLSK